jgi:hypothetical protein
VEGRNAGINNKANAAVLLVRMGHWRLQWGSYRHATHLVQQDAA